jgi:hypothetical protein
MAEAAVMMPRVRPRNVFLLGLGVRLLGALLIWAGDGHGGFFPKVVVAVGLVLSVGGIGVLKWLSFQPRRRRPAADEAGAARLR